MSRSYRVGLVGHGIGPSLTPAMHVREARTLGLDYHYEIVDLIDRVDVDLREVLDRLERDGFDAVNVTHPFKQDVLAHVHERSEVVQRVGSANLVLLGENRVAHNTDYAGFRAGLEAFLADLDRPGRAETGTVVQIGAGGAGLATACALVDLGLPVVVHDRSEEASRRLVDRLGGPLLSTSGGELEPHLTSAAGVVHVTPTGMKEHPGTAFDVARLPQDAWVAEVVYRPLSTELVRGARARGLATLDGGAMAVGQAVESVRLITGMVPDAARMHAHFAELVEPGSAA